MRLSPDVASMERLHGQARDALARWADAVGDPTRQRLVIVGELTGQEGDWEFAVGDNNKIALMSGQVHAVRALPGAVPPAGEVRWSDGSTTSLALLSADQALAQIAAAAKPCDGCRPLRVTAARLVDEMVQTSRGPASAPAWEFGIEGTAVKVTRVAVADIVSVVPPPWNPNDSPGGLSIDSAHQEPDARVLTVSFVGAPDAGDKPCGADYTTEAVESPLAVVVIVIEHRNPAPGGCLLIGMTRTAQVQLAAPLGDRVVLEVQQGLPVPLTR